MDSGQRAVFEREALPHLPSLHRMALYLTRSESEAADLVQETLLRGLMHFDRYEPGSNCRAWLLCILHHTFVNGYRRARVRGFSPPLEEAPEPFVEGPDAAPPPAEGDRLEDMLSPRVQEALMALPDFFREAVVLCDMEGYRYHEAAGILGCPVGTVMSRLYRGRRMLRHSLAAQAAEAGIIRPTKEL
jgi:RNA polymerase sigma-70 factor (ECF subfamily)